jgi:hypothetical protein
MLRTIKDLWFLCGATGVRFDFVAAEHAARVIRRNSAALQRSHESRCNGIPRYDAKARAVLASWTAEDGARANRIEARARARIVAEFRAMFGGAVSIEFNCDPRGAPVRVYVGAVNPSRHADMTF